MIPDAGTLAVFALASLALAVVPGPAVLYIVAQSDPRRTAGRGRLCARRRERRRWSTSSPP